jgi:hypothetical protein
LGSLLPVVGFSARLPDLCRPDVHPGSTLATNEAARNRHGERQNFTGDRSGERQRREPTEGIG